MNLGYVSIVGLIDYSKLLERLAEYGFEMKSGSGAFLLLSESGDRQVVDRAAYCSALQLSPERDSACGLVWQGDLSLVWQRVRYKPNTETMEFYTGYWTDVEFNSFVRAILACSIWVGNSALILFLADRRGLSEGPEWLEWLLTGTEPGVPPEVIAVKRERSERLLPMLAGFSSASIGEHIVRWNPVFFVDDPTA